MKILCMLLAGALGLTLGVAPARAAPASGDPYRIGIVLPLTGTAADYGSDFKAGAVLAEEEINASGGIGGRPIELVYGDSKALPKDGVAEFKRLADVEQVPAIISTVTGVILPQIPLARESGIVLMCVGAVSPKIRTAGPMVFSNFPLADDEEKQIAEFAFNNLDMTSAAIIYENSSYGKDLSKIFMGRYKELGGKIVAEEVIEKGGRDFRSQLTRIAAANPPLIVTYAYYAEAGLIVRQAAELGIKAQFISHGAVQNQAFADIAGPAAAGFISGSPRWDEASDKVQAFKERYRKRYGKEPDLYGPYFYDAVRLLASAIERGGYSKDGIREALKHTKDFPGVNGSMSFTSSNIVDLPLTFTRFEKGNWVPMK